jgi:hypothetical protein
LRNELQPLFVALAWRSERAHRQDQLDHRSPVFKRSRTTPPLAECGILEKRPQHCDGGPSSSQHTRQQGSNCPSASGHAILVFGAWQNTESFAKFRMNSPAT